MLQSNAVWVEKCKGYLSKPHWKDNEVYIDNMLVKSMKFEDPIKYLGEFFQILQSYRMWLNPLKCAFGVVSKIFLGNMVNQRGVKANSEKIKVLIEMRLPQNPKEVQSLTNQIAALSRFITKVTDKCLLIFKIFKGEIAYSGQINLKKPYKP